MSWNHLLASYVVGDGRSRGRDRAGVTPADATDGYGD
jgi:hypothetical protein